MIGTRRSCHSEQSESACSGTHVIIRVFVRMAVRSCTKSDPGAARRRLSALLLHFDAACAPPRPDYPVIGAKNFTEQVVLGELLAQHIEAKTGMKVERRFYLAGSYICNQALIAGRIDSYVEYTGTALTAILKQPVNRDPELCWTRCGICISSAIMLRSWSRWDLRIPSP